MYIICWVYGDKYVPVKDISFNPLPVITQPGEEQLTLKEAEERLKYLSEKNPDQQFIVQKQQA
jgi:hypothetical protein